MRDAHTPRGWAYRLRRYGPQTPAAYALRAYGGEWRIHFGHRTSSKKSPVSCRIRA